jgi:hypothetical protein
MRRKNEFENSLDLTLRTGLARSHLSDTSDPEPGIALVMTLVTGKAPPPMLMLYRCPWTSTVLAGSNP